MPGRHSPTNEYVMIIFMGILFNAILLFTTTYPHSVFTAICYVVLNAVLALEFHDEYYVYMKDFDDIDED